MPSVYRMSGLFLAQMVSNGEVDQKRILETLLEFSGGFEYEYI